MILQNEFVCVEIALMGAELMRIYDKHAQTELLWNGDPAYWKRRSPVLFPNVGKTFENVVKIGGKIYPTSQHGFARDCEFVCETADDVHAVFLLTENEQSLERYPFRFELRISYELDGKRIHVKWNVRNASDREMPFTIGGHPAFSFAQMTQAKEEYQLLFPGKEALDYVLLDLATGTAMPDQQRRLKLEAGVLPLCDELFAHDALIFDGGQVEEVWLCHRDGRRRVGMVSPDFPNYGVWSVKGAPFVCLEPWAGRCDNRGFRDEMANKPNVNLLKPGEGFEKGYSIVLP